MAVALATLPMALGGAGPARAATWDLRTAEKVHELDIMLMVSALRCRFGTDAFLADYQRFSEAHRAALDEADAFMRADMATRLGRADGRLALDRVQVRIANHYGHEVKGLACADVKVAIAALADSKDPQVLLAAAEHLLGKGGV